MLKRRPVVLDALRTGLGEVHGVILLARGSSDNAAVYGRYILELALQRPVALAAPSLWTRYGLAEDLRGQLVVAVSQSGQTPEIVATLEAMRAAGAATPGPVAHDVEEAARAAQQAGSPLIVVGENRFPDAVNVPVVPGVSESLAPLVHVIRAQQLALHTALALDIDPDAPRGFRKVTATV